MVVGCSCEGTYFCRVWELRRRELLFEGMTNQGPVIFEKLPFLTPLGG